MKTINTPQWIVKPLVPEEVYTDRAEFIESLYQSALKAAHRRTWSTVLLGQRRMGKTEIFKRVVNRLFFEQDPKDPYAVVPVYFSFPDKASTPERFAMDYLENFLRYYIGFYTSQPELISRTLKGNNLFLKIESVEQDFPYQESLDMVLSWYDEIRKGNVAYPDKVALEGPRTV